MMSIADKARESLVEHGVLGVSCPPYERPYFDNAFAFCNLGGERTEMMLTAAGERLESPADVTWRFDCATDCPHGTPCAHVEFAEISAGSSGWVFMEVRDRGLICGGVE